MNCIRNLIALLLLFLPVLGATAQSLWEENSVARSSVTPYQDQKAMEEMRSHMARIRETRNRPTVALVLSGGGAKGAAHVGVLKYLEELDIPIDMVLGTSMGGLIGGLCAMGYDAEWMDSLLRSMDWDIMMSDRIPVNFLSYNERKYKEKYIFSVPFYYKRGDIPDEGIYLGADSEEGAQSMRDNLLGSLPSAYITGLNVESLIKRVTVGYQDDFNFLEFPIPYVCVATDMVSYRAKIWHNGDITTALRSTMSIPGLFAPVKTDGMVLVDGGMRNNFPADIAREAGADLVIGVDLAHKSMGYAEINNLGDLLSQTVDMLGRDAYEHNVGIPDVYIKPYMKGYGMLSFDSESISDIIDRGYQAAISNDDGLRRIKRLVGDCGKELNNVPAKDLGACTVAVSNICFSGMDRKDERFISRKIKLEPGPEISYGDIQNAVAMIYSTGAFKSVTYELKGKEEPYELVIKCTPGPVNRLGLGVRFDSESMVSALVNLGFNTNSVAGSSLDISAKLGTNPYADFHYRLNSRRGNTINADALFGYTDADMYGNANTMFNVDYWRFRQRLYFSNINWSRFDIKFGASNEYVKVISLIGDASSLDSYEADYPCAFIDARLDTTGDSYFPESGLELGFRAGLSLDLLNDDEVAALQFDYKHVHRLGNRLSFIPYINARAVDVIENSDVPVMYSNIVGGSMAGRYLDQQIPFVGINYAMPVGKYAAVARADLRLRLGKSHYVTAIANGVASADAFFDTEGAFSIKHGLTGMGFGMSYHYDSIIGPLGLNVHWSDITGHFGAYFSIGFDF